MFAYRTKLVVSFVALFLFTLIGHIVDHFYISKLYRSSDKVEDTILKLDYFSRLQLALERSLMPANDYLIHGNPVEKANAMNLISQVYSMFEIGAKMDLTDEEHALLKDIQTNFDEVKHVSEEIFAIENPIGDKAGAVMSENMDALAYAIQEDMRKIGTARYERTINAMSKVKFLFNLENRVYWISIYISIFFAAIIGLFINRAGNDLERQTIQIETERREWEKTFDAVDDFITIHDKDYNLIRVNKATAERLITTPQALTGKKCYELFHGTSEPHPLCPHKKTIETGEPASVELDDPYLGGIFLTSTYPLINEKGELYAAVHIVKDITEMRRADQKVRDEAEINKTVLKVAKLISSTMDEEAILQEVVRITPTLVKGNRCVAFLWDDSKKVFLPGAAYNIKNSLMPKFKALQFKPGELRVFDEVKRQKTSIVIEDPIDSSLMPLELVKTFDIKSNLKTPIISHGEVIGILCIDHTKEHIEFTPRDIAVVEGIAAQIGIALQNARLHYKTIEKMLELEHRIGTIQVMHELDKNILTTLNRDEMFETVVQVVRRVVPADRIIVALVDKEAKCFRHVAGFSVDVPKDVTVSFANTNAADVLRTGRPISRPNIPLEKNLLPFDSQLMEQGLRSDIRVPIKVKGEIVALLCIGSHTTAAFTREHLSMAKEITAQLAVALEHTKLFSDLQELLINTVKTLTSTIDAKSPWTRGHSERVTGLAVIIGKEMGLTREDVDNLRLAGLLHDIGKIGTAEHITDKPGRLTDEEFAIVKEHPLRGAEILKPIKQFASIIPGIAHHHERVDETGYPYKLKNRDIHIFGRILAVADTYDAMTTNRPYRKTPGREKAVAEIIKYTDIQFDPAVVDAFLKAVEKGLLKQVIGRAII